VDDPNAKKNFKDKVADQGKRMKGEGDCFNPAQFKPMKPKTPITCYQFDNDMNPFVQADGSKKSGTTTGKVSATNAEACMVAFARAEVEDSVQQVDRALAMVSGMICQAKKDGKDSQMPAEGESLDLTASFDKGGAGLTGSTAKITRLADVGGNPVYRSDITTTAPDGKSFEVHLVHSPGANDSSSGTLSILRPGDSGMGAKDAGQGGGANGDSNKNALLSINYSREQDDAGKKRMRFEVRRAAIVKTVTPFDANGLVNLTAVADNAQNAELGAVRYLAFDIDPDSNAGNLSYWQNPGGNFTEPARGFLFNITAGTDGSLSGCGVSGATGDISIRKYLKDPVTANELKPVKWYHPFRNDNTSADKDSRYTNPNNANDNQGPAITKQCFKQNAASGVYEITTTDPKGYEVIPTAQNNVQPPTKPKAKLEGDFRPKT